MSQTTYPTANDAAFAGQLADASLHDIGSYINENANAQPFGIAVKQGTADNGFDLPASAADCLKLVGVLTHSHAFDNIGLSTTDGTAIKNKAAASVLRKGKLWVKVEEAVTPASAVYVRFATGVADNTMTQKGAFRASPDGTAEVQTVTPTAANAKIYVLRVETPNGKVFEFEYISDGSGTATEACDALRALMAADAQFSAEITGSGTATLILTATANGKAFKVFAEGDGVMAVVVTTPAAPSAALCKGAKYLTSAAAAGFAQLDFNNVTAALA